MGDADRQRKRNDSAYRKVVRKTWRKQNFRSLPDDLKILLLYLWTGPDAVNPGIYYISTATIADDLGTVTETVRERLGILSRDGWLYYDFDARVVFLPKWDKFDPPENGNVCKSFKAHVADLPDTKLTGYFITTLKPYCERFNIPLDIQLCIPLPEPIPNGIAIQEQEQEQEQEQGAAQKQPSTVANSAPSAPQSDSGNGKSSEEMRKELSARFGWNGGAATARCFSDYMLAVNDWLKAIYPASQGNDTKVIAGKLIKTVARNAFGKTEQYHKSWYPPEVFVEFLRLAIGEPKEGGGLLADRRYPSRPAEMIRYVNQVFHNQQDTHEYAHAAIQSLERR